MARPLRGLGVAAGALSAVGAGLAGYVFRRALPQVDGEIRLRALNGPVDVIRDRWGVPHISALDEHDAFFAQGFCHAQDRLWQMDLNRRLARGQLAEVFGPSALDVDRFVRRVGFHRAAEAEWQAMDLPERAALTAYCIGVNACLDGMLASGKVPVEFTLARYQPHRWEPLDSLAFGRFFAFTQSPNWESELIRSRLIARLGHTAASALEPDVWKPGTDALPRLSDWGPAEMPRPEHLPPVSLEAGPPGSNGWVVSGSRSATGKPLLANDPHLFPRIPAIFYEMHLVGGGDLMVAGGSIPGVPGIGIGHNRSIAWGITAGMADVQDFFVERLHPGDARRVEFDGHWETGTLVRESIAVKGRAEPWIEDVLVTPRHGPLVTPTPAIPDEHRLLALKSSVLEAPGMLKPLLALNRADGWESFRAALSEWGTPVFNFVYADTDGNIGYQMAGRVPVRARGEGLVPSPGWTGQYEWIGIVRYDEMPRAFNPPDGLWATANQDAAKGNRHFFGREFVEPARYRRIRQVLESRHKHSAVDFRALQADVVTLPGREIARILGEHLLTQDPRERAALETLRAWDGHVSADSGGAAIYEVFRDELTRARHAATVGDLLPALLGAGPHPLLGPICSFYLRRTLRILAHLEDWAARRVQAPTSGAPDEVSRAFSATVKRLGGQLGSEPKRWSWGRLHPLRLQHALSVQKPLGLVFDVPAFSWRGDLETVLAGGPVPGTLEAGGPSSGYRIIADTSDWDATLSCIPGGQSGHRASPHYADQVSDWRRVAYHPLAFTRPAVLRHARHTLRLRPA